MSIDGKVKKVLISEHGDAKQIKKIKFFIKLYKLAIA